jgi:hypothetical protein
LTFFILARNQCTSTDTSSRELVFLFDNLRNVGLKQIRTAIAFSNFDSSTNAEMRFDFLPMAVLELNF